MLKNKLNNNLRKVLRRIEEEDKKATVWIVGPETGRILYRLVRVLKPVCALEIGTSVGYSALWIAEALAENCAEGEVLGRLWTVESHAERFARAEKNIEEAGMGNRICQIKGHAPEVFSVEGLLPEELDFAFFDATKLEHQSYFDSIFPRMKSGGMIVVDNVLSHRTGEMAEFIKMMHCHKGLETVEIPVGDGLLISRII
jgi:predicted O-methyltransferase YrrM